MPKPPRSPNGSWSRRAPRSPIRSPPWLEHSEWPSGVLPLAMAGSFLLSATIMREEMIDGLTRKGYQVSVTAVPDPVRGAVILAERGL